MWLEGAGGEGAGAQGPIPEGGRSRAHPPCGHLGSPGVGPLTRQRLPPHVGTWTLQPAWLSTVHRDPSRVTVGDNSTTSWCGERTAPRLEQCQAQSAVRLSICLFKAEAGGGRRGGRNLESESRDRPTEEAVLGVWHPNSRAVDCALTVPAETTAFSDVLGFCLTKVTP